VTVTISTGKGRSLNQPAINGSFAAQSSLPEKATMRSNDILTVYDDQFLLPLKCPDGKLLSGLFFQIPKEKRSSED